MQIIGGRDRVRVATGIGNQGSNRASIAAGDAVDPGALPGSEGLGPALPQHVSGHGEDQHCKDRGKMPSAGQSLGGLGAGETANDSAADEKRRQQPVDEA